jgi:hypothetical protein
MSYPHNGQYFPSRTKKYEELIFFVPFYEGSRPQLQKHIDFVNELGFDAFIFQLAPDPWSTLSKKKSISLGQFISKLAFTLIQPSTVKLKKWMSSFPNLISSTEEFGLRHLYADQIEMLLNSFMQPKIVYSFSNPSHSAIKALSRRKCSDISALICDSGPAAKNFVGSVSRLNFLQKFPGRKIQSSLSSLVMSFFWGLRVEDDLHSYLEKFPQDFPILSIRGWKDPLIKPDEIDAAFDTHDQLRWSKLSLPEAAHLNGLRDFAEEYEPQVTSFLKKYSHVLNA